MKMNKKKLFGIGAVVLLVLIAFVPAINGMQLGPGEMNDFKNYDILVTPTLPCPAFKPKWLESGTVFPIIGKKTLNITSWMTFTYPFNMSGLPAASIPSGWTKSGLPIGMQIVGRRYDEKTVLQVSKAFEEIAPWQDKRPKFE